MPLPANGLGPEFELQAQAYAPRRVGLALDDAALASALRRALLTRTDLTETDESEAAVIIADHPVGTLGIPLHAPVLIVGADRRPNPGESVIRSLDPGLILPPRPWSLAGTGSSPTRASTPTSASPGSAPARSRWPRCWSRARPTS